MLRDTVSLYKYMDSVDATDATSRAIKYPCSMAAMSMCMFVASVRNGGIATQGDSPVTS